ncbi:HNH endonuclease [Xanthobacter dioxanivorans]|uniref:HNH endonuclease n=1 Tax=Xanthobacter dioxanivorans TaxID=2528964 RepID=A0A974PUR7_9HYPH|nr:HNH endonuclease [Xanthobacter dioxanivorans]QRG09831.1 HNH endonuclease [Xanthobacter dioxanivorans]
MARAVEEWIATSPDAKIPDRVKLRIWAREEGRCYLTGKKIRPGDAYEFEHKLALCLGGEHRESNIALALKDAHKAKTAEDVALRAKSDRIRKRHLGIRQPSHMAGARTSRVKRKINGQVVDRATGEPIGGKGR